MKRVTFAVAFVLTVCLVIGGVAAYPDVLGQAATNNNDLIFAFFLGPFSVLLFFAWVGEKVVLKLGRRKDGVENSP
jgi:membrane protease YdiL (CAAX protease family)